MKIIKKIFTIKKIVALLILVIAGLIIFPNRAGLLKATGFWESDFLPSTSNAIFETNKPLGFIARIGDSQNPKIPKLTLNLGTDISFTFIKSTPTKTLTSTDSGVLEISEQIAQLDTLVNEVSSDVSNITGDTSRSFFGPYESVTQNGFEDGPITYYIDNNSLIQTWKQISNTKEINFLISNPEYSIKITPNQDWIITKDNQDLVLISTKIATAIGENFSLPNIEEKIYPSSESQALSLQLPTEILDNYEDNFPITITRTISVFNTSNKSLPSFLNETIPVGIEPTLISSYKDSYIYFDKGDKSVKYLENQIPKTLISDILATGISCTENECVVTDQQYIYKFSPENITSDNPPSKSAPGYPIGGSFLTENFLYITNNSSPTGQLIQISNSQISTILLENLAYAENVYFANDSEILFWANGQLNKFSNNSNQVLNIPSRPIHASLDNQGYLYLLTDHTKAQTKVLIRISPNNLVEIASKLTGQFTGIQLKKDSVILGLIIPNHAGVIWEVAYSKITWLPVSDFVQQY